MVIYLTSVLILPSHSLPCLPCYLISRYFPTKILHALHISFLLASVKLISVFQILLPYHKILRYSEPWISYLLYPWKILIFVWALCYKSVIIYVLPSRSEFMYHNNTRQLAELFLYASFSILESKRDMAIFKWNYFLLFAMKASNLTELFISVFFSVFALSFLFSFLHFFLLLFTSFPRLLFLILSWTHFCKLFLVVPRYYSTDIQLAV
jgi:hypothetical protein